MVLDVALIQALIDTVREGLTELKKNQGRREEELEKDKMVKWGIEHGLQTTLEACLDIARHIVSANGWGIKTMTRDYFRELGEKEVIGENLSSKMAEAMSVRNRLVHEYAVVSTGLLMKFVREDLDDIESYIKEIAKYLENSTAK